MAFIVPIRAAIAAAFRRERDSALEALQRMAHDPEVVLRVYVSHNARVKIGHVGVKER